MNPLTVTWTPHIYTNIGWQNFQSWLNVGGFDNSYLRQMVKCKNLLEKQQ